MLDLFYDLFIHDYGFHAHQGIDGSYRKRPGSITKDMLKEHLAGKITLADYGTSENGLCKWGAFDFDVSAENFRKLRNMEPSKEKKEFERYLVNEVRDRVKAVRDTIINSLKIPGESLIMEFSGRKGYHLFIMFDNGGYAIDGISKFLLLVKQISTRESRFNFAGLEQFPMVGLTRDKLNSTTPKPLKLPLAYHQVTKRRAYFIDDTFQKIDIDLKNVQGLDQTHIEEIFNRFKDDLRESNLLTSGLAQNIDHTDSAIKCTGDPALMIESCSTLQKLREKARQNHHLDHDERLILNYLLTPFSDGRGEKIIHEIMAHCNDYDPFKTQFYVAHNVKRRYKPISCQRIIEQRLCDKLCENIKLCRGRSPIKLAFKQNLLTRYRYKKKKIRKAQNSNNSCLLYKTLEEIRKEFPEKIKEYLINASDKAFLARLQPGVGKTILTSKTLKELGMKVFWAGKRHDLYKEVQSGFKDMIHLFPKVSDKEEYCMCEFEDARKLIKDLRVKGWGEIESDKICKRCVSGFKDCKYYLQFDKEKSMFGQHPHLGTKRIIENEFGFDVIVIDEEPFEIFYKEIKISSEKIKELKKAFNEWDEFTDNALAEFNKFLHALRETLEDIRHNDKFILGQDFLTKLNDKVFYHYRTELFDLLENIDQSGFYGQYDNFIFSAAAEDLPHNWLGELFKIINEERPLFGSDNYNSRLRVERDGTLIISSIKKFFNRFVPLIILDATGIKEHYQKFLDRELIEYSPQIKLDNEVIQVTSGSYGKTTLLRPENEKLRQKLLKITEAIIKKGKKTLIVTTQAFLEKYLREKINKRLLPKYEFAYYWGIRGTNDFSECDQVILLGAANPDEEDLAKKQACFFYEDKPLDNQTVDLWKGYENTDLEIATRYFRNGRLNTILWLTREAEMIQDAFRIRPLSDNNKKIYIICNIPLSGLAPTKLITIGQLEGMLGIEIERKIRKDKIDSINLIAWTMKKLLDKKGQFTQREVMTTLKAKVSRMTFFRYFPTALAQYKLKIIKNHRELVYKALSCKKVVLK